MTRDRQDADATDAATPQIALTGATGFLGSHIADRLLKAGYGVRASIRTTSSLRWITGKPIQPLRVDLAEVEDCRRLVAGCAGVIHCAGVTAAPTEEAYRRGNVDTTAALLTAAGEACGDGAFVLISSLAAHGPADREAPAVEGVPDRPISAYGRSKLAAERLVLDPGHGLRGVVLRPPSLYGPRDRDFLPLFRVARRGWTVRLGRQLAALSLVDGRDAAAAAVALLAAPDARGVYYVDDGRLGYALPELTAALAVAVQRPVRTLQVPLGLLQLASRLLGHSLAARSPVLNPDRLTDLAQTGWVCDGGRLATETGFRPKYDAKRGLSETYAAYRREGWL